MGFGDRIGWVYSEARSPGWCLRWAVFWRLAYLGRAGDLRPTLTRTPGSGRIPTTCSSFDEDVSLWLRRLAHRGSKRDRAALLKRRSW